MAGGTPFGLRSSPGDTRSSGCAGIPALRRRNHVALNNRTRAVSVVLVGSFLFHSLALNRPASESVLSDQGAPNLSAHSLAVLSGPATAGTKSLDATRNRTASRPMGFRMTRSPTQSSPAIRSAAWALAITFAECYFMHRQGRRRRAYRNHSASERPPQGHIKRIVFVLFSLVESVPLSWAQTHICPTSGGCG